MFDRSWVEKRSRLAALYEQIIDILEPKAERDGLVETPLRVAKAWQHWTGGYEIDPVDLLKTFKDGAEQYDEMVFVRKIPFHSHCEHHMAPFFGRATIAYIPKSRIVGISKLARVLDAYSRRLQVQERITVQIANLLETSLEPLGVGVYLEAEHMCMSSRGVRVHGADTVTTAFRGALKDQPAARAEFLALVK